VTGEPGELVTVRRRVVPVSYEAECTGARLWTKWGRAALNDAVPTMQSHFIPARGALYRIDPADDVAVALRALERNELNDGREISIWKTGVVL
jgi:hypothetical protein